jgi:hypothetical protein
MRRTFAAVFVSALLAPALAPAQDVSVDYDKGYDYSKIKTYAIKIETASGNPLSEKRIVSEVDRALAGKGWTKATSGNADAVVLLHGASETKHNLNTFYTGGGWRWGGMGGTAQTSVQDYTVGTLVVDIFDGASKQLIFRGTASDELSDKMDKNQKKVAKATDKMFKNFPPAAGK